MCWSSFLKAASAHLSDQAVNGTAPSFCISFFGRSFYYRVFPVSSTGLKTKQPRPEALQESLHPACTQDGNTCRSRPQSGNMKRLFLKRKNALLHLPVLSQSLMMTV